MKLQGCCLLFSLTYYSLIFLITHSLPNQCNEKCGDLEIPFPFHLNSSCASPAAASDVFRLSCTNVSTLYVGIGAEKHRVLEFFPDGGGSSSLLLDLPSRHYSDLNSFEGLAGNENLGVTDENVIGLYDCEDSSVCRAGCEGAASYVPGSQRPACCYPLSDRSVWRLGDGFSVFSGFGCRGFSSWVVVGGSAAVKRGVKVEWAVPGGNSSGVCARESRVVNVTAVKGGVRCVCQGGFVGDGFSTGNGCIKSCIKDTRQVYGSECNKQHHNDKKLIVIVGVLSSAFIVASFAALFFLLKQPGKPGEFDVDGNNFHSGASFRKAFATPLFTFRELNEATSGFRESQRLVQGAVYSGTLLDGFRVFIHETNCENERDLTRVLSRIEALSCVPHQNLARVLGCCVDSPHSPLVVYELPPRGTLEENLPGLGWPQRLNAAVESSNVLAFLHHEISPPMFHSDLRSGLIFLDDDLSAKVPAFGLLDFPLMATGCGTSFQRKDVYDMGMLLVEVVVGSNRAATIDLQALGLSKMRNGRLEEIVDPALRYHKLPSGWREQIERVAELASRCLLFSGDGKIGMADVSWELGHIAKQRGPALEETFSNSSLLQMISMSPDSIYLP